MKDAAMAAKERLGLEQASCTLVSPGDNFLAVMDVLEHSGCSHPTLAGEENSWQQIQVQCGSIELTFSSMVRKKPGDRYSKIILGMYNFFRADETDDTKESKEVLDRISSAQMLIGIVANPDLSEECCNQILAVAKRLDAMIFTGKALLDWRGNLLLQH